MSTPLPAAVAAHAPIVTSRRLIIGGHTTACSCGWGTWYPTLSEATEAVNRHRAEVDPSTGHIAFIGGSEYYELGGEVYRAPLDAVKDVRTGARIGRWECSRAHWDRCNRLDVLRTLEAQA